MKEGGGGAMADHKPVSVSVKNFSLTLEKKKGWFGKQGEGEDVLLLRDISAEIQGGQLVAIMGGSGSGKTTLLNCMAGRMHGSNVRRDGSILLSEEKVSVGYVLQSDFLLPYLTVRETLRYAALLRLPKTVSREQKYRRVEEVILELGLKDCANTKIGNEMVRGLSGGEKRRVSIACQMLTNPSVLFLDEPTTGLDSFTANNIVETLSNMTRQGRTVICSIHQPRSDIFHLLDSIMLLSKGRLAYWGKTKEVFPYFSNMGYDCPSDVNPADFFLDIVSVDYTTQDVEEESRERVEKLVESYATYVKSDATSSSVPHDQPHVHSAKGVTSAKVHSPPTSPWTQITVLTRRSMLCILRDKFQLYGGITEALLLGLLVGAIFYKAGDDNSLAGLQSRLGMIYSVVAIQFYAILVYYIYKLVKELRIFDFEYDDGMYSVVPYVISQLSSNFPIDLINGFLYALVTYWMVSLRDGGSYFGIYALIMIGVHFTAIGFAWMCASLHREYAIASLIGNFLTSFFGLTSGFLLNLHSLPVYVAWIKYISFINYAYQLISLNEFHGAIYPCPQPGTPTCQLYTGDSILQNNDTMGLSFTKPAVIFVSIFVFFRLISAVALRFIPFRPTAMSKNTTSSNKSEKGLKKSVSMTELKLDVTNLVRPQVDIKISNVSLFVRKVKTWRDQEKYKKILNNVTDITIKSGRVFAIMGGSGSGKTSLLNLIGGRIINVKMEGLILFNDQEPSRKELNSLVGYVMQNDYLLPALTVRETLQYAALMRLPDSVPKSEKFQRVEDVIQELGLKDCANTRIGDESIRGISGGEKRRVSIGIQLITDPSILLLDEPTSGLDSFTANKLVESLSRIARRNRTVILSIHQPRSDIYALMDDILLLTKGNVAYCGPREDAMGYFAALGFQCPGHTNPADFYLDITSVDLRNAQIEEKTRERVKMLVESYDQWRGTRVAKKEDEPVVVVKTMAASSESTFVQTQDRERTMAPFSRSFPLLVRRAFTNIIRSPPMTSARLSQVSGFGLILLLFYCRLGHDYYSIQNRIGLLYEAISPLLFTGMLNNIAVFPTERNVFYREKADGAYSSQAFLFSYMVNEIPFELITCMIYTIFVVPAAGLQTSPYHFFTLFFIFWCLVFSGESFGLIFCGIFYTIGFSVTVTSVVLSAFCGMVGLISINMPKVLQVVNHISIMKYAAEFAAINEFTGLTFTCTDAQRLSDGSCPITDGAQVIETYQFHPSTKWQSFGLVILLAFIYRVIAFLIFKFIKRRFSQ